MLPSGENSHLGRLIDFVVFLKTCKHNKRELRETLEPDKLCKRKTGWKISLRLPHTTREGQEHETQMHMASYICTGYSFLARNPWRFWVDIFEPSTSSPQQSVSLYRAESSLPTHSLQSELWNSLSSFVLDLCTHLSGCVSHAGLDADHVGILSQTFMGSTACGSQHQHYCYSCKILYLLQQYVQREMYYQ